MLTRLARAVRPALFDAARAALNAMAGRASRTGRSHRPSRAGCTTQPSREHHPPTTRETRVAPAHASEAEGAPDARVPYPGDVTGPVDPVYSPVDDAAADPGEIVWAWVPYEEDHSRGKDRPALVIGRDGGWLLALPLTSQDHDRDAAQEARAGRYWIDIGTGPWDAKGRPSEARVDRVVRLAPGALRRVGHRLDEATFQQVADAVRAAR